MTAYTKIKSGLLGAFGLGLQVVGHVVKYKGIYAVAVAVFVVYSAGLVGVVSYKAYRRGVADTRSEYDRRALAASEAARVKEGLQSGITYYTGMHFEEIKAGLQVTYNNIRVEIPQYVTPKDDAACPINVGFVRVYNAAASGSPISEIPGPPGKRDGEASGVVLSTVSTADTLNFEVCRATREQLIAAQDWIEKQRNLGH